MFKFKKIFIICCAVLALTSFSIPLLSQAAPSDALEKLKAVGGEAYGAEEPTPLPELIGNIINIGLSVLGIVAVILFIYGGYLWMTGRGKEERITKAKETLEAAIIGLIIILAAYAITYFVVDRLMSATGTPTSTTSPTD
jgi:hypothetical protein